MFGGAEKPADHSLKTGVQTLEFDNPSPPVKWIGFIGDILPLMWRKAEISAEIREFFDECDGVVGNLEGVFTRKRWVPFLQKHTGNTFDALLQAAPAHKWCLSVANNHAGDFGEQDYLGTLAEIERRGMRHFGALECPAIEVCAGISVQAWTEWQNRPSPWVCAQDPGAKQAQIAYPHWGYEYERHPRQAQRDRLPRGYRAIVGHHAHFSQPIERGPEGALVAWSLGNFVTEVKLASMGEGAVLKVGFDQNQMPALARHAQIRLDRSDPAWCRVGVLGSQRT
jgi:poly-gamma-glutamate capsule biosynthesis protein CapA/YwtB (metallophosphatase superfamily)